MGSFAVVCGCSCFVLTILTVVFFAFVFLTGFIYGPRLPKYDLNNFHVYGSSPGPNPFTVNSTAGNSSLVIHVAFDLLSRNPNSKADFEYVGALEVVVSTSQLTLGKGAIPGFRQGHNTTAIPMVFQTAVLLEENAVSILRTLDPSDLLLVIKVDANGRYKLRFPLFWKTRPVTFWMDIRCSARVNVTGSESAPAAVKHRDCDRKTELDDNNDAY